MRIHHIINQYSLKSGGAQRIVQRLHLGLRERGIESFVLGLMVDDENLPYASSLGFKSPYCLPAFMGLRRYVIENVKEGDVVHAHLFPTNLYLSVLKKLGYVKVPLVSTEHSTSNRRREKLIGRILDTFTYAGYDGVVAISKDTERELLKWKPELNGKTQVVNNGARLAFSSPIQRYDKKHLIIVSVGNLRPVKNYETAIKAMSLLKDIDFEYQIAGSGQNLEILKQQCSALGLESKVLFLGYVDDIHTLLAKADIFLMPSRWEGFGLAVVEAMNASLPVVVSNVPGVREVVDYNPPCALLIEPESPESIAKALRELADSDEKRVELGRHGFKRSEFFGEEKMIKAYCLIYSEMLKNSA